MALAATALALVAVLALGPGLRDAYRGQPEVPAMVAALRDAGQLPPGAVLAVDFAGPSWTDALGLMLAVHRDGHRACLADGRWAYMVTGAFVCGPDELDRAVGVRVRPPEGPPGAVAPGRWDGEAVGLSWGAASTAGPTGPGR